MLVVSFVITTSAGGAYTSTDDASTVKGQIRGEGPFLLHAVEWIDGTLDDGVDAVLSITSTPSGVDKTLLTLTDANDDAWYYPQTFVQDNTGADTAYYTLQVVTGQLKLAVTSGGATKTGGCKVYLLEA